ncbi:MAG TPA: 4'-phosphopantetheinyl transferase superfamily protein [Bacteroidales bacterium]|nr:4'-phosphopantetheinyl transferase superfamily protein [Bacteroidales bacterium]
MPVLFTKNPGKNTVLGVWQITETVDELVSAIDLSETEKHVLNSYKHDKRKKHWLSYRVLISKLSEASSKVHYSDFGKPYLLNDRKSKHISITHSGDYSAVIIDADTSVGIDIEEISRRIERVSSKFLSDEELVFIDKENFLAHLTICWTAKEALFKISGNDYYDFKEQIKLFPFKYAPHGSIQAELTGESQSVNLVVHFEKISDYFLSYVIL